MRLSTPPFYRNTNHLLPLSWYKYQIEKWFHWKFKWHKPGHKCSEQKVDCYGKIHCRYCGVMWEPMNNKYDLN